MDLGIQSPIYVIYTITDLHVTTILHSTNRLRFNVQYTAYDLNMCLLEFQIVLRNCVILIQVNRLLHLTIAGLSWLKCLCRLKDLSSRSCFPYYYFY